MSLFLGNRNRHGLTEQEIESCLEAWAFLCGARKRVLMTNDAHLNYSRTRFDEKRNITYLGADVYPGQGSNANSRLSMLACLAHELSHIERFERGYDRPIDMPDMLLDESETSLNAAFHRAISRRDKADLIEDARDRLIEWLAETTGG
jgi:hypothetical protein